MEGSSDPFPRRRLPNRRRHELVTFMHDAIKYHASISRFENGDIGEIFLSTDKPGSQAETVARDAAVVCSIALQFGAPIATIKHALTRLQDGNRAAGPLGAALDLFEERA